MKTLKLFSVVVAAGVLASPVLACGDGWMGMNLVATPDVKSQLRQAYLAANPELAPHEVGRAVAGRTYYGFYSGTSYAVATFRAYPTIFRTDQNGRWKVRRQTYGGVCTHVVPSKLINFPDEGHWVLKPANSAFWHREVFTWLKHYAPPGGR